MFAAAVLAADIAATLDLSDRSEVRVRATQQTPAPPPTNPPTPTLSLDLFTQPDAHLRVYDRRWELTLGYTVGLLAPDVEIGFTPMALQTGSVGVAWHDRKLRLTLSEDAAYGLQNSAYLSAAAQGTGTGTGTTPPGQPVTTLATAAPATLLFGSTRTAAGMAYRFDRQTTLNVGAEFFITGGLNASSQATLPDQVGERATATFEHDVSRSDALLTVGSVQHVDFSAAPCVGAPGQQVISTTLDCQPSDQVFQVVERLRHDLSRTETLTLGFGSAVSAIREVPTTSFHYAYYPVAEAGYTVQLDREGRLAVLSRLAPYVDPRTGIVLNALQGDVTLIERLTRPLTLTMTAGASQNLPAGDPAAASILRGEVNVEYRLNPQLMVTLGERGFWENENGLGNFVTALSYVAVTVREPTLHF